MTVVQGGRPAAKPLDRSGSRSRAASSVLSDSRASLREAAPRETRLSAGELPPRASLDACDVAAAPGWGQ